MECPHIPDINYGEFSRRLHKKVVRRRVPITGSIEVTARCNLQCHHCYINESADDRDIQDKELSSDELCGIIDQIVQEGCLWLLFTGGEPFIRPDFPDIYTYAKKKGLLITLFTNGTAITPRLADHLAIWRPFSIEITLYGHTQETYERVTGVSGSYERCIRGIDLLLERNLPLKLKSMVTTQNKHEIWEMKAYAERRGLDFRFDPMLNKRLNGDSAPATFRIAPRDVLTLDMADEKRWKAIAEFTGRFQGKPPQPERIYQCGAGMGSFHIDPVGRLSVCIISRSATYDLRQGAFVDGWHDFIPRILLQEWSRKTPCENCELISLCGQCPGWATLENGDPETPVEYLCEIAHLRARELGFDMKLNGENHDN